MDYFILKLKKWIGDYSYLVVRSLPAIRETTRHQLDTFDFGPDDPRFEPVLKRTITGRFTKYSFAEDVIMAVGVTK